MLRFHGSGMNTGRLPSHMRDGSLPAPTLSTAVGRGIASDKKAFPFGGPNAWENVQWTFSSEDGPVRPMGGGLPRSGGSDEVEFVLCCSLFQSLPTAVGRGTACGGGGLLHRGGLPSEPGTSPAAHHAVSLARSMVPAGKSPFAGRNDRGPLPPPAGAPSPKGKAGDDEQWTTNLPQRGRQGTTSNGQQTFPKGKRLWDLHVENLGYDSARGLAPGASVNSYTI